MPDHSSTAVAPTATAPFKEAQRCAAAGFPAELNALLGPDGSGHERARIAQALRLNAGGWRESLADPLPASACALWRLLAAYLARSEVTLQADDVLPAERLLFARALANRLLAAHGPAVVLGCPEALRCLCRLAPHAYRDVLASRP